MGDHETLGKSSLEVGVSISECDDEDEEDRSNGEDRATTLHQQFKPELLEFIETNQKQWDRLSI